MEKAQGVRLYHLAAVQDLAEQRRRVRNAYAHDGVAGFGTGQKMADRTDSADPRGDGRHLIIRASLRKFLKAANLRHMQLGVRHLSVIIELDRDFRVTLNSRDGVNHNFSHWFPYLSNRVIR